GGGAIGEGEADRTIGRRRALFVNAAILTTAATVFHQNGHTEVAEIDEAYRLLSPMLGVGLASTLFAVALLASGINSTVTATLAGQIVMEGYLDLRIPPWARRLLTRGIAIIPVIAVTALFGERGTAKLLVLSQVALSVAALFRCCPAGSFRPRQRKDGASGPPGLDAPPLLARGGGHRPAQPQAHRRHDLRHASLTRRCGVVCGRTPCFRERRFS